MNFVHNVNRYRRRQTLGQQGFSAVELMMVVGIIGIMSAIAFPMIISSIPNYRLKEAARDTLSSFQKAKLEAVKRNSNVSVTFNQLVVADAKTYDYVIFMDDGDLKYDEVGGETTLAKVLYAENYKSVTFGGVVAGFSPINADGLNCFTFNSRGLPKNVNGGAVDGKIRLNNSKGTVREVDVSLAGRIKVEAP